MSYYIFPAPTQDWDALNPVVVASLDYFWNSARIVGVFKNFVASSEKSNINISTGKRIR